MTTTAKPNLTRALRLPMLIVTACAIITFSAPYKTHPDAFALPLLLDLLLMAPIAYYLAIRKTSIPLISVLRFFVISVAVAGLLLSKSNTPVLVFIKTWISPLAEATLIGFVGWKFYRANQKSKAASGSRVDFVTYCRTVLAAAFGNYTMATVLAAEVAVFYYAFSRKAKAIDYHTRFTGYKENGTVLVLNTFLCLLLVEAVGMHFLFLLWNTAAAWVLTALSFYTCLQLFAHIRALKKRPVVVTATQLLLYNGLMGGEATVDMDNIEKIEMTRKLPPGRAVQKLALIKGLENHNLALYVKEPVPVLKAFGIQRMAGVLLLQVDQPKAFIEVVTWSMSSNIH